MPSNTLTRQLTDRTPVALPTPPQLPAQVRDTDAHLTAALERIQQMRDAGRTLRDIGQLTGTSTTTISDLVNGNHAKVGAGVRRKIYNAFHLTDLAWPTYHTDNIGQLTELFDKARHHRLLVGLTARTGSGKTVACEYYTQLRPNTFYVRCDPFMSERDLLAAIQEAMGTTYTGRMSVRLRRIAERLTTLDSAMLILDEFSEVRNPVYRAMASIVKLTEHNCAVAIVGTEYVSTNIATGTRLQYRGFAEIARRLRGCWEELGSPSRNDVDTICDHQGIRDAALRKKLYKAPDMDYLRKTILAHHQQAAA